MKITRLTLLLIFLTNAICFSQPLQLIPQPAQYTITRQSPFILTKNTPFFFVSGRCMANVIEFNAMLKKTYGFEMKWTNEMTDTNEKAIFLHLTKDSTIQNPEGYKMEVNSQHIKITANTRDGMFYGTMSLLQLMKPSMNEDGAYEIPACTINDEPRFAWRGMHLDVCRHFFGKEFVKKYIDLLALHKMNTFHWHLTDDQGWRIEIKKYPKLTEIGGWRNGSMIGRYADHQFDTIRYGGYYTQDDIREIVKYAQARHITIVPEIEMPGHALAALAAYPELSCTGGPFEVCKEWGVFDDVFCAGNDYTFQFIEDVLTEVTNLFPGKYIHIGGDECPKTRWKVCSKCQKRMKDNGLKDEHELQSYFIGRIEKFLNSKGKQIIGWDEILEGGLAPNASVMSWRGEEGGIAAANQQHYVVMSPGSHCYFDHYQGDPELEPHSIGGFTPLEKVYSYNPVPKELNDTLTKYIMGAQANLWTEYILDEKHAEYMAYPRACALAEVLWTPKEKKNEDSFQNRLIKHFSFLDKLNVNYATSIYQIKLKPDVIDNEYGILALIKPNLGEINYRVKVLNHPDDVVTGNIKYDPNINHDYLDSAFVSITKTSELTFWISGRDTTKIISYFSKSTAKKITYATSPSKYYCNEPDFTLIDGIKADTPRKNNQWNAWNGEDVEMTIDLNEVQEISQMEIGYLHDPGSWIWLPKEISISISTNGKKYKTITKADLNKINDNPRSLLLNFKAIKARYVKIKAVNPGKIPEGNPGVGEDSWLFFDEILID